MRNRASLNGRNRLSTKGALIYLTLWAAIFAVVRVLAKHSSIGAEGPYPHTAGQLTELLLPVAIGLVSAAVGVAVAHSLAAVKQIRAVALWCFAVGYFSLPMLWVSVVVLAGLGIISLD